MVETDISQRAEKTRGAETPPIPSIAWLGPRGNFTHIAVKELQKMAQYEGLRLFETSTINGMFDDVQYGRTTHALVPVENSSDGHVSDFHRNLLDREDLRIDGELVLPISQSLYFQKIRKVKAVVSKDSALGQCKNHIEDKFGWEIRTFPLPSTGAAVSLAAKDPYFAAIGSPISAEEQGLGDKLEKIDDFNDKKSNATTFAVIRKGGEMPPPTGRDKTTFIMTMPNSEGELVHALDVLADKGVDLNKLKSIAKINGSVSFLVSADGHELDGTMGPALSALEEKGIGLKRLGSYPKADYTPPETDEAFDFDFAIKRIEKEAENGDAMNENKRIIVFTLKDHPGALRDALRPFADKGVNLTAIDSQPSGLHDQHIFYLAFDKKTEGADQLIDELQEFCTNVIELQHAQGIV